MDFALKLFRINIYNTYHKEKVCNDFQLIPDETSQEWMKRYCMRLVTNPGYFEVFWLTARITHPLQLLQEKMDEVKLAFYLLLYNPQAISYSALNIEKGKVYHFSNIGGTQSLHQGAYVTEVDRRPIKTLTAYFSNVKKTHLGLVEIHLKELCKRIDFIEVKLPVDYTICIQAKEAI